MHSSGNHAQHLRELDPQLLDTVTGGVTARAYLVGGKIIYIGCTEKPPKGAVPYSGPVK